MSVIGNFIPARDGGWTGTIRTLTIDVKVRFVPNDDRNSDESPAFRVVVGHSRIGEAWSARSSGRTPKDYLRVLLDDPSLNGPLHAALFQSDDGREAQLVWSRRETREKAQAAYMSRNK